MAVADCGGPIIPLRGGRIDATGPGRAGVPEPHQDLQTHIENFRLQGFNPTEMIELVACGHTLGGVESADFPTIVDQPPGLPSSFSESAAFDGTTSFDTAVVTQYLDGSTLNPLVSGRNETTRSDLRIFSSDGNVTMKALSNPVVFKDRCKTLFERMLNTVPANVNLTEVIELIPEKPQQAALRIVNGTLTFFVALRVAVPVDETPIDPSRFSLFWCDRYGDGSNCQSGTANRIEGAGLYVPTQFHSPIMVALGKAFHYYYFQAPIDPNRSVSHFWWEVTSGSASSEPAKVYNNGGTNYPLLQDDIFILPALTTITDQNRFDNGTLLNTYLVVAAAKEEPKPHRVYIDTFDNTHGDLPVGTIITATIDLVPNATFPAAPGYMIYSGQFDLVGSATTADFRVDANGTTATLEFQPIGFPRDAQNVYTQVPFGVVELVQIQT
ncbi:hypothetical protein CVT24_002323 [Panaeolus cyanescens]|uniref:Peroxidase n=1 Tax=Panaeolus cyanescens TaxID=181874 RepID=A0A409YIQ5_9AGAR|nr:hypothetical protein CVT24_002323 [Panaeolus cyanescens]